MVCNFGLEGRGGENTVGDLEAVAGLIIKPCVGVGSAWTQKSPGFVHVMSSHGLSLHLNHAFPSWCTCIYTTVLHPPCVLHIAIPKRPVLTKLIYNRMEVAIAFWSWSQASSGDTRTLQTEELQVEYKLDKPGVALQLFQNQATQVIQWQSVFPLS